jgi:16S rRNA (guanine527-N7)-methyltransferase
VNQPAAIETERTATLRQFDVSRETTARLDALVRLLRERQQVMNLVSRSSLANVWTRHVADSLQLLALAPTARTWIDLGSGGGFPGRVVACALAGAADVQIHLVESTGKKARFLSDTAATIELPVVVHVERIEQFVPAWRGRIDVVTARALAPLTKLLDYTAPLIDRGAKCLFLKGQDVALELTEASEYWKFQYELVPSVTDSRGRIMVVTAAKRLSKSR